MTPPPKLLKIEVSSACNAACAFCLHKDLKRAANPFMSLEMFTDILDAFPGTPHVQPQWFGESFLHPRFQEIVGICKDRGKKVSYYTNGSLVHDHPEAVTLLGPGDVIKLSAEAMDKKTYETVRQGLDWDRLLSNVELIRDLKCSGVKLMVRLMKIRENARNFPEVVKFWKKLADSVQVEDEAPRGVREVGGTWTKEAVCARPREHFTVSADGRVALCCMDWEKTCVFGNVRYEDPKELWDRTRAVRDTDKPLCRRCPIKFVPAGGRRKRTGEY